MAYQTFKFTTIGVLPSGQVRAQSATVTVVNAATGLTLVARQNGADVPSLVSEADGGMELTADAAVIDVTSLGETWRVVSEEQKLIEATVPTQIDTTTAALVDDPTSATGAALSGTYALKGEAGGLGVPSVDGAGNVVLTYTSLWGVTAGGVPYYDPDGAAPGEERILQLDANGSPTLTEVS